MSDHDFEATVETDHGTFTFSGDDPMIVSAQAARMPVVMHRKQIETWTDLTTPVQNHLEKMAHEQEKLKESASKKRNGYNS